MAMRPPPRQGPVRKGGSSLLASQRGEKKRATPASTIKTPVSKPWRMQRKVEEEPEEPKLDPEFLEWLNKGAADIEDPIEELVTPPGVKGRNATPIHFAAWNGDLKLVTFLVTHCNADVNVVDHDGFTPVCRAIYRGHNDIVYFLLQHSADLSIATDLKHTALHFAVYKNSVELIEAVLSRKRTLDIDAADRDGTTALHWAALRGYLPMARILVTSGAEVDATDIIGCTPLHLACTNGAAEVTRLLVEDGEADRNFPDRDGCSPLHLAAKGGHLPCMVALNAILETRTRQDETPLTLAVIHGHTRCVRWLLVQGTDPNCVDARARTPMHYAVEGGIPSLITTLLDFGADLQAKDTEGCYPADLAPNDDIRELLKKPRFSRLSAMITASSRSVSVGSTYSLPSKSNFDHLLPHVHASAPHSLS